MAYWIKGVWNGMQLNMVKLPVKKGNLFLRVAKGHFATSHSHINY